jgi:tetratricopeptide (TPR) repeat protein
MTHAGRGPSRAPARETRPTRTGLGYALVVGPAQSRDGSAPHLLQEPLSRLSELQRRVQSDPAPFVFAQLAEEYCRAGRYADAVACCRTGLDRHPGYLTARLILGRALVALARWDEAADAYLTVVTAAPDNLAATRELAETYDRQGRVADALQFYRRALALARNDRSLEAAIAALSAGDSPPTPEVSPTGASAPAPSARVDFDAVLVSLGHPDQQPPPVIELLLTDPTALLAPAAGGGAVGTPVGDDALGRLERDLRNRVGPASIGVAVQQAAPDQEQSTAAGVAARSLGGPGEANMRAGLRQSLAPVDAAVIADLEAWLDALARDRAATSPP